MLQCNDIDGLMVDWLYGELDDDQASRVSGHVDACARCQSEQAAFSRTREMFSVLPEHEPPSALTAMLIREAALSAPASAKPAVAAPEERKGGLGEWLSRLFQPLMHPAAAAVATLVLVVGVAGVLYVNGNDQFAEPTASSTVSSDSPALQGGAEARPGSFAAGESADPADSLALTAPEQEPSADRVADIVDLEQGAQLREEQAKAGFKGTGSPAKKPAPARIATTDKKRDDSAGAEGSNRRFAKRKPIIASAPPMDDLDNFDGELAKNESDALGFRGQKTDWAASKEGALVRAFKAQDCKTAAAIANDIRDRDPNHYRASTAELEAVKKCRFYVNKERNRRSAVARKRASEARKSKASKASGSAAKPKAAAEESFDAAEADTAAE